MLRFLLGAVSLRPSALPAEPEELRLEALPLLDQYMLHLLKEHVDKVLGWAGPGWDFVHLRADEDQSIKPVPDEASQRCSRAWFVSPKI